MDFHFIINLVYIVSSFLFIYGLKLLNKPATARRGNLVSALGMFLAVVVSFLTPQLSNWLWIFVPLLIGSLIGLFSAKKVQMTQMPEMVALFNGSGGMAALLLGWWDYHGHPAVSTATAATIILSVLIGGLSFSGSIIAWGKLKEVISGKPITMPGQKWINLALVGLILTLGVLFAMHPETGYTYFIIVLLLAFVLGVTLVLPIGGADMPVVISLLNSYTGMAASAAGIVVHNNILIVAGAVVGASGFILTRLMCKAMNRSLSNVFFSGFGSPVTSSCSSSGEKKEAKSFSVEEAYHVLEAARFVVIVPGYGLAVAQAQHVVRELADFLEKNDCEVKYAIHPVAGRMPGHMNVLLAEANISYDQLIDMDEINPRMENVDVCLVIGANDVVNPAARNDKTSPIYGMPIINADKAKNVFVLKRSMASGFAGIDNPLFYNENTRMIFGDAKATLQGLVKELKGIT